MNFETLAFGVVGVMGTILLVLVSYSGDRMNKSIDQLRDMLDERLKEVTIRLTSIDRDLNTRIADVTQENFALDRRITRIETMFDRRGEHKNEIQN
jgi:hypothetical protein